MVLTDISMPVMNGIELIKAIRHDLLNITVPILVVSSMRLRNGEVNPGWNKFLQKPSDIDTMLSTIAELLGNKI